MSIRLAMPTGNGAGIGEGRPRGVSEADHAGLDRNHEQSLQAEGPVLAENEALGLGTVRYPRRWANKEEVTGRATPARETADATARRRTPRRAAR